MTESADEHVRISEETKERLRRRKRDDASLVQNIVCQMSSLCDRVGDSDTVVTSILNSTAELLVRPFRFV